MNRKKKVFTYTFWLWLAVMFVLTSIPGKRISPERFIYWDKLAHLSEYFILGVLYHLMRNQNQKPLLLRHYLLMAIILPVVEELHQLLIPRRSCSYLDVIADIIGISLSFLVFWILKRRGRIRL